MLAHLALDQGDNLVNNVVDVQPGCLQVGFLREGANPPDDFARPVTIPDDALHGSPCSSRSGVSRASHRRQALPFVITAASGWLTSWAIEAVSAPRVDARDMRQLRLRSVQGFLGLLRSVMSLLVSSSEIGFSPSNCSAQRLATTTSVPSRRVWTNSPSQRPVRVSSAVISLKGAGKSVREMMRNSSDCLPARPAVLFLCPTVPIGDHVSQVAHEDRVVGEVDQVGPLPQSLCNPSAFGDLGLQLFCSPPQVGGPLLNSSF